MNTDTNAMFYSSLIFICLAFFSFQHSFDVSPLCTTTPVSLLLKCKEGRKTELTSPAFVFSGCMAQPVDD